MPRASVEDKLNPSRYSLARLSGDSVGDLKHRCYGFWSREFAGAEGEIFMGFIGLEVRPEGIQTLAPLHSTVNKIRPIK